MFAIQSLDIVLGLVGGLSSILWGFLFFLLGGYEQFKLSNSLIGYVYPISPTGGPGGEFNSEPENENEAKHSMMRSIADRKKYFYNYHEYIWAMLLSCFCICCCKKIGYCKRRSNRLKRHREATERLNKEIDIVTLLYVQRVT